MLLLSLYIIAVSLDLLGEIKIDIYLYCDFWTGTEKLNKPDMLPLMNCNVSRSKENAGLA